MTLRPQDFRLDFPLVIALATILSCGSCSKDSAPSGQAQPPKVGSRLFDFDDAGVTELEILKHDPADPDTWSARLTRGPGGDWEIASGPEGLPLVDRRADSTFVAHLVDTFRTIQVIAQAPKGPLSSFGLEPPHFAFRWKAGGGRVTGLQLGARLTPGAALTDGVYAQAGDGAVVAVRGATLKMIEYLISFEVIRRRRLLTVEADDVDEIELWSRGRRAFYALREGERWVDARERKLPVRVTEWLTALTHIRVRRFLDDGPTEPAPTLVRLVLRGRGLQPIEVLAIRKKGQLIATISSRPRGIFALHDEAIELFRAPLPR